jgi:preprotein translocase subunit YajC
MKKLMYSFLCQTLFLATPLMAEMEDGMPSPEQGIMQTVMMISIALIFFYFILWRPEQKRRKEIEVIRSSLKKGDRVTAMGILGNVVRVEDQTVILKMYDGSKIQVLKGAITDVQPGTEEDAKKADKDDRNTSKRIIDINDEE